MNKIQISLMEFQNMLTTILGNLLKEKSQVLIVGGTNKTRKAASTSERGKRKMHVNMAPENKDGNDKGTCFHNGMKGH